MVQPSFISEIRAHKNILALVNVFKKCFYRGLGDNGSGSIDMEDSNKDAFEATISFIYNQGIDMT